MSRQFSFPILLLAAGLLLGFPALAHDSAAHPTEHAGTVIGNIEVSGAFSRATLPGAPVAGGFLTLNNKGATDDLLVSASAPIAAETQLHEMAMEGDVMKMRQLAGGIPVPAGESVMLKPGGLHIMFMGLNTSLAEGDVVPVTLTFEQAGTVTVDMAVGAAAAAGMPKH
jgi:copper(I)-binding protein